MFDRVTLRVSDRDASEAFYAHVLRTLEVEPTTREGELTVWRDVAIVAVGDDSQVTRGLHIGFVAPSREHVDAFWRAGVEAGHRDDGAPGPRPQYTEDYYGAFLLDPDGNSAEAVHHGDTRNRSGIVDHLWIGVADVSAAQRFYETLAPQLGARVRPARPERTHVATDTGSFALVADGRPPSENVDLAFPVASPAAVDAVHRAATSAGYRENASPRDRGDGTYAASILDADGNSVSVVCPSP